MIDCVSGGPPVVVYMFSTLSTFQLLPINSTTAYEISLVSVVPDASPLVKVTVSAPPFHAAVDKLSDQSLLFVESEPCPVMKTTTSLSSVAAIGVAAVVTVVEPDV